MKIIINASPIIVLSRLGLLDLSLSLFDELLIPTGVKEEILNGPEDEAYKWIMSKEKELVKTIDRTEPLIVSWDIGKGETEVLSYAYQNNEFIAGLDDKAARKCAAAISVKVIGSIGIIIQLKQQKKIESVKYYLEELNKQGFRLSKEIYNQALLRANEK